MWAGQAVASLLPHGHFQLSSRLGPEGPVRQRTARGRRGLRVQGRPAPRGAAPGRHRARTGQSRGVPGEPSGSLEHSAHTFQPVSPLPPRCSSSAVTGAEVPKDAGGRRA